MSPNRNESTRGSSPASVPSSNCPPTDSISRKRSHHDLQALSSSTDDLLKQAQAQLDRRPYLQSNRSFVDESDSSHGRTKCLKLYCEPGRKIQQQTFYKKKRPAAPARPAASQPLPNGLDVPWLMEPTRAKQTDDIGIQEIRVMGPMSSAPVFVSPLENLIVALRQKLSSEQWDELHSLSICAKQSIPSGPGLSPDNLAQMVHMVKGIVEAWN